MTAKAFAKMASKAWKNKPSSPAMLPMTKSYATVSSPWDDSQKTVLDPTNTIASVAAQAAQVDSYDSTSKLMATQGGDEDETQPSITHDDSGWKTMTKHGLKKPPCSLAMQLAVTTVLQDDDSDKKMLANSTMPQQDVAQQDTAFLLSASQNRVDTTRQQDEGTGGNGLGWQWLPQLFDSMFSPMQLAIRFLPKTASQEGTPIQNSEEEGEQQNESLLGGLDELEDDPQDILLFQMDKAMGNIGAASPMFTQEEKRVMKNFWCKWHFTLWESIRSITGYPNHQEVHI